MLAQKHLYNNSKHDLKKVQFVKDSHSHNTIASSENKLVIKDYRIKTFGQRTVSHQVCLVWNSLPNELREIENFLTFKRKVWQHHIENPTIYNFVVPIKPIIIPKRKKTKPKWTKKQKENLELKIREFWNSNLI